jgi:hypothetical protein
MVWFDTSGNVLKVRDATNTVWQTVTGINAASESTAGVIEIATQAETNTGTDDTRAVTPKKLADGDYSVKRQYQEFLSSGTWNKPTGIGWVYVELIGGGGGGSRGSASIYGNGGGGGGFNSQLKRASDVTSSVTVTVGAGGAVSAATNNSNGGDGGDSTFGSYATGKGGKGGVGTTAGGAGGAGSAGGTVGGLSAYADASGNYRGTTGGNSIKGGGGGGGATTAGTSVDAGYPELAQATMGEGVAAAAWAREVADNGGDVKTRAVEFRNDAQVTMSNEVMTLHTVREGEDFRTISKRYYGDDGGWRRIMVYNGYDSMSVPVGVEVIVPRKSNNEVS